MDEHSIERIRNANFSHAVRGYDRGEVDRFLAELADWLERGGEDDAAVGGRAGASSSGSASRRPGS